MVDILGVIPVQEKCIRQLVMSVETRVRYLLGLVGTSRCIAVTALRPRVVGVQDGLEEEVQEDLIMGKEIISNAIQSIATEHIISSSVTTSR